jgi:hypothetical protein
MGYYHITKFQEQAPGTTGAAGRIVMPSGLPQFTLERRRSFQSERPSMFEGFEPLEGRSEAKRLLDPQLYLAELSSENCAKVCASLVTYPWFSRVAPADYDSGRITQRKHRKQIKDKIGELWRGLPTDEGAVDNAAQAAVAFQQRVGCDAIILPSPLTMQLNTTYDIELAWLDAGLKATAATAPGKCAYATVAISDMCTSSIAPESSPLLEVVLDQVSAREPGGVYLVMEQRNEPGYYITSPSTVRTVLRLVSEFKEAGVPKVLVCWLGTAGLLALAAGADDWASGWYRSERSLRLDDYPDDDSTKLAAPAFYSHRLAGEVHPNDLNRIRDAGALDLIEEPSPMAARLFDALRAGLQVEDVVEWKTQQARGHFNTVMIRETAALQQLTAEDRVPAITRWLTQATDLASTLSQICGGQIQQRTSLKHQAIWLHAFQKWDDADHG